MKIFPRLPAEVYIALSEMAEDPSKRTLLAFQQETIWHMRLQLRNQLQTKHTRQDIKAVKTTP